MSSVLDEIVRICTKNSDIDKVILHGSRARGTNMEKSDIDIALEGRNIDIEMLNDEMNKIDTLLQIDLVDIGNCKNELLKNEVEKYGVTLYSKI